jgi:formylglycine-generating enzyme required for sulfatase activity
VAAPKGADKVVQIDASVAQRLAYYKANWALGVLAPRGWYCFGTYGSAGATLFVSPQPVDRDHLFRGGNAVEVSEIIGETSGRFTVARFLARVFPAQKAFVQRVIKEGLEPASDFPFGPYPNDQLIFQGDRLVEYQTPPRSEGLGVMGELQTNDDPIHGVVILSPDGLLFVAVRLSPDRNDLTLPIIQQIERDNAALMESQGLAEPVRIENRHIDRKLPGCGNEREGCAHAELDYMEVFGGPAAARERINAAIVACVTGFPGDSHKLTPEEAAQDWLDTYTSTRKQIPSMTPSPWTLESWVKVLRTAAPVFSLECGEDSFGGGAHGWSGTKYLNFDPATGEPVKLSSILKENAMARLTAIAEVHFRQVRKLSATGSLDSELYHFRGGRFALNDNYGFGEKALDFYFNTNEIASHALGPTLVEIPYAEIRDLIRPEAGESNGLLLGPVAGPSPGEPVASPPRPPAPAPSVPSSAGARPGDVKVNPKDGLKYVWIPPGRFMMGCSPGDNQCDNREKPAHQVTITKGFWMGQTAVTQEAYQKVTGTNPSYFKGAKFPVETVSWNEAQSYCQAVGMGLPTEAEWEYAARAGTTAARYGNLNDIAWNSDGSDQRTHEVGLKQANAFGLYDMLGNVAEWVADWFGEYPGGSQRDPGGPARGLRRVNRGGFLYLGPYVARASSRGQLEPDSRSGILGFRCAGASETPAAPIAGRMSGPLVPYAETSGPAFRDRKVEYAYPQAYRSMREIHGTIVELGFKNLPIRVLDQAGTPRPAVQVPPTMPDSQKDIVSWGEHYNLKLEAGEYLTPAGVRGPELSAYGKREAKTLELASGPQAAATTGRLPTPPDELSRSFVCPENYSSRQEQQDAIAKFISSYQRLHPNSTVGEMLTYRYSLLVSHSCNIALSDQLGNVTRHTPMLRFVGRDFGPQVTHFNIQTKVWSSYYTLNGQGLESPDEELIFNFYFENLWATPPKSGKLIDLVLDVISGAFENRANAGILWQFAAPDAITHILDFFITADIVYPDQNYGYLYVMKVSPIQNSVYSVTYSKKFIGPANRLVQDMNNWRLRDLKANDSVSKGIGEIKVDASWIELSGRR